MRAAEEAFRLYRLVWALEAVRVRRMSLGWSPETVVGAARQQLLKQGVPQFRDGDADPLQASHHGARLWRRSVCKAILWLEISF